MDSFAQAMTSAVQAEIAQFGEEASFRGVITHVLVGTSKEVKAMEAAGYMQNEGLTITMLPHTSIGLADRVQVNETVYLRQANWRIHQIEQHDFGHAYTLTIEKIR